MCVHVPVLCESGKNAMQFMFVVIIYSSTGFRCMYGALVHLFRYVESTKIETYFPQYACIFVKEPFSICGFFSTILSF